MKATEKMLLIVIPMGKKDLEDKGMKAKPQNLIKLQMKLAREERVRGTTKQSENI